MALSSAKAVAFAQTDTETEAQSRLKRRTLMDWLGGCWWVFNTITATSMVAQQTPPPSLTPAPKPPPWKLIIIINDNEDDNDDVNDSGIRVSISYFNEITTMYFVKMFVTARVYLVCDPSTTTGRNGKRFTMSAFVAASMRAYICEYVCVCKSIKSPVAFAAACCRTGFFPPMFWVDLLFSCGHWCGH